MRGAGALLNGDKPDWLISDSPDSGRVLTPANPRKDREHLYIASRVLAICFRTGEQALTNTNQKVLTSSGISNVLKNRVN